ncbi:hypothetical protein CH75_04815 [Dyella jiangningensis]|nr:hypothetical protein CH75_04815 [Dyella jiangningensis]
MSESKSRTPWYAGLGKNIFLFMVGLNYFGYTHYPWDSFVKWAWIGVTVGLCLQFLLGVLYALKAFLEWLLLRLGENE